MSKNAALSGEQRSKLADWVNRHSKNPHCPVCSTASWAVGEHLISGNVIEPNGGVQLGGLTYPQAFIVCQTCSYVRYFMAMPIGLIEADNSAKSDQSDG